MGIPDVRIDPERLLGDLHRLRRFGACGTGVVRRSLSPVDVESRHWLRDRFADAGLDARIDGVGNVIGRARRPGPALLLGSHTDTQPEGGWLDGPLGVICGLEVARTLSGHDATRDLAVDVASWIDEEGAFHDCVGSISFVGELPESVLDSVDENGRRLGDAIREAGLADEPRERLDPGRYAGYLEAHIEQGPYLEEQDLQIGVVTAIVGVRNLIVEFEGRQNHAGTTPMARRRDAFRALVDLAGAVHATFPRHAGPRTVWTIGEVGVEPGARSIVPGRAWMNLQFRDEDEELLDRLESVVRDLVARADRAGPVAVRERPRAGAARAAPMDAGLRAHLERAAEHHAAGAWTAMPSAAAHDAQVIARHLPSAMLFVPSIDGVSHAFEEDTREEDIVLGCQVLATAVASILEERR